MSVATGEGYNRISSIPPPSWPEAPRPQDSSWIVTADSLFCCGLSVVMLEFV